MMKYLMLLNLLGLSLCVQAQSTQESAVAEVEQTIKKLFDGMRAGDSMQVHQVFSDEVQMRSVYQTPKGEERSQKGELNSFLLAVGTPHDEVWDERIGKMNIAVHDRLAQAWVPYHFYLGDRFSHCGVNAFQLIKEGGTWKIINLTDTRRRTDCPSIE